MDDEKAVFRAQETMRLDRNGKKWTFCPTSLEHHTVFETFFDGFSVEKLKIRAQDATTGL